MKAKPSWVSGGIIAGPGSIFARNGEVSVAVVTDGVALSISNVSNMRCWACSLSRIDVPSTFLWMRMVCRDTSKKRFIGDAW